MKGDEKMASSLAYLLKDNKEIQNEVEKMMNADGIVFESKTKNNVLPIQSNNSMPWVHIEINKNTGIEKIKILPNVLAEHIRTSTYYIFVKIRQITMF